MATRRETADGCMDLNLISVTSSTALYGLAKFKKQEDTKIIKKQMMQNVWNQNKSGRNGEVANERAIRLVLSGANRYNCKGKFAGIS